MKSCTLTPSAAAWMRQVFAVSGRFLLPILGLFMLSGNLIAQPFTERSATDTDNPFRNVFLLSPNTRSKPAMANLDTDADLEMVVGRADGKFDYFQKNGSGVYALSSPNPFATLIAGLTPSSASNATPDLGDFNGDGTIDLIAGNGRGNIFLYENFGGVFQPGIALESAPGIQIRVGTATNTNSAPAMLDYDNDGDMDVIVGRSNGSFVYLENDGFGYFTVLNPDTFFPNDNPMRNFFGFVKGSQSVPHMVDWDCDGDLDCVASFTSPGSPNPFVQFWVFRRRADNSFNATVGGTQGAIELLPTMTLLPPSVSLPVLNDVGAFAFDADGDGDHELVSGHTNGGFRYFRNDACLPTFTVACPTSATINVDDPAPMNPDGSVELTAANIAPPGLMAAVSCPAVEGGAVLEFLPRYLYCTDIPTKNVTVIARDINSGRKNTCIVPVTVRDGRGPDIVCRPYTVNLGANGTATFNTSAIDVNLVVPAADRIDNCGGPITVTLTNPSNATFNFTCGDVLVDPLSYTPPAYTIQAQATDQYGNVSYCTTYIVVKDVTAPVPATTSLPTLTRDLCQLQTLGAWPPPTPTANDACDGVVSGVLVSPAVPPSALGLYTLTWRYIDGSGNSTTQTQTLVVQNNAGPVFQPEAMCGTTIPAIATVGCTQHVDIAVPIAEDCDANLNAVTITGVLGAPLPAGSNFPVGTTNVTFIATDIAGNVSYCTYRVVVGETIAPTVTGPVVFSAPVSPVNVAANSCGQLVSWVPPSGYTLADNCSNPVTVRVRYENSNDPGNWVTITPTSISGGQVQFNFPTGDNTVEYRAYDASMPTPNSSLIVSFVVTVIDNIPPTITCPNSTTVNANASCVAQAFPSPATASDNCGVAPVTQTDGPLLDPAGLTLPLGPTTFAFETNDPAGNGPVPCSFTITVVDATAPQFTNCPSNITVQADGPLNNDGNPCTENVNWTAPTAPIDDCSLPLSSVVQEIKYRGGSWISLAPIGPYSLPEGVDSVRYWISDFAGNTGTCIFTVTVRNSTPPSIICPNLPVVVNTDPGLCTYTFTGAVSGVTPIGPAPCDQGAVSYRLPTGGPVTTLTKGTHPLVAVTTDAGGLSATCNVTVIVQDNQAPTLTSCPSNPAPVSAAAGCVATVTWGSAPVFGDNCPANLTINASTSNPAATVNVARTGGTFPLGETVVFMSATDGVNTGGACFLTVTVVDDVAPTITCPASVSVNTDNTLAPACGANVNLPYNPNMVSDNCGASYSTPPAFDVDYAVSGATTVPLSYLFTGSTELFNVGVSTVTYTAYDLANNSRTCTFTVTVTDTQGPTFPAPNCGISIPVQVVTSSSACSLTLANGTWQDPIAMDLCSTPVVLAGPNAQAGSSASFSGTGVNRGGTFPVGITTVRYVATDVRGNTSSCTFNVIVRKTVTFACSQTSISTGATCAAALSTAILTQPTPNDNCPGNTLTYSIQSSSPALPTSLSLNQTITVTWRASDGAGNFTDVPCVITITDGTAPTINCTPGTITVNSCESVPSSSVVIPAPTATDNCTGSGAITITQLTPTPSSFPLGTTPLTWRATDASGNSSTCVKNIVVNGSPASLPILTVLAGQTVNLGNLSGLPSCCSSPTVVSITLNASPNPINIPSPYNYTFATAGTYTLTYVVSCAGQRGANGSKESMVTLTFNRQVTVTSTACGAPTIGACPANVTVSSPATCPATVSLGAPTGVTDNCSTSNTTISNNAPAGGFPCDQTTSVTFTATDPDNGLTAVCAITVTVGSGVSSSTLSITCPADITVVADADGSCMASLSNLGTPVVGGTCTTPGVPTNDGAGVYPVGITPVEWEVTGCALARTCTQNVTVTAAPDPTANGIDEDCDGNDGPGGGGSTGWLEISKRLASDGALTDNLGVSVDIDGDWAVTGAHWEDDGSSNNNRGAAYILHRTPTNIWTVVKKITPSDGLLQDLFGESVAIWVNPVGGEPTVVIGARWHDNGVANSQRGAAYVYRKNKNGPDAWGLVKKLTASDASNNDEFGTSVDIDQDVIVVGAPNEDLSPSSNNGAIYVFHRDNGGTENWGQIAQRRASDRISSDLFGASVSVSTPYIFVGSRMSDPLGMESGSVYVFERDLSTANNWGERQKITAIDGVAGDQFGVSVSVDGTTAVVGSYFDNPAGSNSGSAYVYERNGGGTWDLVIKLEASDGESLDQFGYAVDIDGDNVVVGARYENTREGSIYIFNRDNGGPDAWGEVVKREPSDGSSFDQFGSSVAISGCTAIVGSPKHNIGANNDQGAVYFYNDGCPVLRPANPAVTDRDNPSAEILDHTGGFTARCFPNPFSELLNIELQIEEDAEVNITVNDVTGRVIASVYNGLASPGQRFQWDAADNPAGLYFVRIEAGANRKVVPVSIVK